jgi:hypothetical protein
MPIHAGPPTLQGPNHPPVHNPCHWPTVIHSTTTIRSTPSSRHMSTLVYSTNATTRAFVSTSRYTGALHARKDALHLVHQRFSAPSLQLAPTFHAPKADGDQLAQQQHIVLHVHQAKVEAFKDQEPEALRATLASLHPKPPLAPPPKPVPHAAKVTWKGLLTQKLCLNHQATISYMFLSLLQCHVCHYWLLTHYHLCVAPRCPV